MSPKDVDITNLKDGDSCSHCSMGHLTMLWLLPEVPIEMHTESHFIYFLTARCL